MSVTIPEEIAGATRLTEAEVLQELAVALFQREKLTMGQASKLASLDRIAFQRVLASRHISVHYDVPELEADVLTLRETGRL